MKASTLIQEARQIKESTADRSEENRQQLALIEKFAQQNEYTQSLRKVATDCRNAQRLYFSKRTGSTLTAARSAEQALDKFLNSQQTIF